MHRKLPIIAGIILFPIVIVVTSVLVSGGRPQMMTDAEEKVYRATLEERISEGEPVLASYHGWDITQSTVEIAMRMRFLTDTLDSAVPETEQQAIEEIALGRCLYEEARRRGINPTDEELEAYTQSVSETYQTDPDIQRQIDNFLTEKNLSFKAYLGELRLQESYSMARENVTLALKEDYCMEHGLPYSPDDPPAAATAAAAEQIDEWRKEVIKEISVQE